MIETLKTFGWLLIQAIQIFVIVLPVSILLAFNFVLATVISNSKGKDGFSFKMLTPIVWPFGILFIASVFLYKGQPGKASELPALGAGLMWFVQIAHSVWLTTTSSNRWVSLAIGLLIFWFSCCCAFMASMALSNSWM